MGGWRLSGAGRGCVPRLPQCSDAAGVIANAWGGPASLTEDALILDAPCTARADVLSRVGRQRVTDRCRSALVCRPPSAPGVPLARHPALRWTCSRAGRRSASRLPSCPPTVRLVPFALWSAFPTASVGRHPHDYYGTSVPLGLASCRPSRFPSVVDVRARRRCPVRPLEWARCPSSTRRRVRAPATLARYPGGPAPDALQGTCPCITGGWGSGSLPFTISRGSRGTPPSAPSGSSRFPTMLLSPLAFAAR